ncbi:MAG: hemerythrin family protein [Fusobacteriaceae bacterium]|nr:hemerythrin family protein [Fusobacteriaceae bacterium]MBU9919281.1 bacteriohemerythrin [Fusobacteriaceae bacterium]
MKWNDEYSIGIVEIDEQHKKLFELSEILNEATEINEIKDILLFLEEYMQFHFNTEESMMRKYNYELIEEHKKLHDDLKEKVTGYIELYFLGNYSFIEELEEVVQEWIYEHILEEDRKYKEFFKNKHITF